MEQFLNKRLGLTHQEFSTMCTAQSLLATAPLGAEAAATRTREDVHQYRIIRRRMTHSMDTNEINGNAEPETYDMRTSDTVTPITTTEYMVKTGEFKLQRSPLQEYRQESRRLLSNLFDALNVVRTACY